MRIVSWFSCGAALKDKNGSLYLHDLDPNRGNMSDEPKIQCGIMCEAAEAKYSA